MIGKKLPDGMLGVTEMLDIDDLDEWMNRCMYSKTTELADKQGLG